jgi:hypothetical protein
MLKEVGHKIYYYKMSNRTIVKGTSPKQDKPLAIFVNTGKNFQCYSLEEGYFTITFLEKSMMRKKPRSAKYMLIGQDKKDPTLKNLDISKQCKILTERGIKLKDLTDGKINIFRTGSAAKTSLQLFYDLCDPDEPDKIQPFERDILEQGHGALICGKKSKGICYKYDICSEYPSLLASAQHRYPIGEGELKTLSKDEFNKLEFFYFGMYHVKVINPNRFIFSNNPNNWYTHTDLNFAKKLKYKLELIEDDQPNCLFYSKDKQKNGREIFGKFVNYLFELKQQGHKDIKAYLNALWGALTQTNKSYRHDEVYANKEVLTLMPMGDDINFDGLKIGVVNKDNFYETDFARIKPFLLSYGRCKTANIIMNNLDNIVRVHTDGIILKRPIDKNQKLGNGLGDLKYEGCSYCEILNSNNYIWMQDRMQLVKSNIERFKIKYI